MAITVEAVYEDGVLKPSEPLPLKEHDRVQVTVYTPLAPRSTPDDVVERTYGLLRWTGDPEVLRRIAEDDEYGILESP